MIVLLKWRGGGREKEDEKISRRVLILLATSVLHDVLLVDRKTRKAGDEQPTHAHTHSQHAIIITTTTISLSSFSSVRNVRLNDRTAIKDVNARENARGSVTFSATVDGDINYTTIALKTHRAREHQTDRDCILIMRGANEKKKKKKKDKRKIHLLLMQHVLCRFNKRIGK